MGGWDQGSVNQSYGSSEGWNQGSGSSWNPDPNSNVAGSNWGNQDNHQKDWDRLWIEVTNEVYKTELNKFIDQRETEEMKEKEKMIMREPKIKNSTDQLDEKLGDLALNDKEEVSS